jgi:NAD+ kinase
LRAQRSSGLWVSTACGSTAAIRSAGGAVLPRSSRRLQYLVREPYTPPGQPRPRGVVRGVVRPGEVLVLVSHVRRGMLWADGPYRKLALPYGEPVILDEEPRPLRLVLPTKLNAL